MGEKEKGMLAFASRLATTGEGARHKRTVSSADVFFE